MSKRYLAFDLGAESGRAMLGSLQGGELRLEELHRFPNTPVRVLNALHWDALRLFHEIRQGMSAAGRERRSPLEGIGIDTWGVDFALLGSDGSLCGNPRHYRDARNNGMLDRALTVVPREEIFARTGVQFMQINTLVQLYAMRTAEDPALASARTLLMIPDLFNYWLTGVARSEITIASTSQLYNPREKRWAVDLLEKLGLPASILPPLAPPGSTLGPLTASAAEGTGLSGVPVFAGASHDTASAVAAAPAEGRDWLYISSGTWSLMGAELDEPAIDAAVLEANLTNEAGAAGTVRLLRNIAGLWLLQECRRAWALEGAEFSYEELAQKAAEARPFAAILDPDAFLEPGDMPRRIAEYCRSTGQGAPSGHGEMARSILESLALRYREVLESIERVLGRRFETIHIVGGGSRNQVLNQFVADATSRTVIAGPAEATAIGNVLVQAIGSGALAGLAEARAVVRRSFETRVVKPAPQADWDKAYRRFQSRGGPRA